MSRYSNILFWVLLSVVGLLADEVKVVYDASDAECQELKTIHGKCKESCEAEDIYFAPTTQCSENAAKNFTMIKCLFAKSLVYSTAINETYTRCFEKHPDASSDDVNYCPGPNGVQFMCKTNALLCTIVSLGEACKLTFKEMKDAGQEDVIA